jgi:hypothetical protein
MTGELMSESSSKQSKKPAASATSGSDKSAKSKDRTVSFQGKAAPMLSLSGKPSKAG